MGVTGTSACIAIAPWRGNAGPTTYAGVIAQAGVKFHSLNLAAQAPPIVHTVDHRGFPNADLWAAIATGVTSANSMAIVFSSDIVNPVSTVVGQGYVEWIVEFRFPTL
jgi:hypothetical protein